MNIPTPNQIPVPLDLSELPDHILRSGAVEALTNQNEDLMARLSVVLRKTSKLEDQIAELEKIIQIQTHKLSVGHDQLMIYQEKEKTVLEKNKKQEVHYLQLKEQIQLLEMQYAELFTTSKNRTQSLNQQLERVGRRLQRYIRYRARIKMGVKSLRKKIKLNQNEWNRLNNEHREMKLRLGDAIERIQYLSRTHENNQKQLVENYESSLKELQKKLDHKEKQCEVLEFKTQKQEELFEQNITLENRAILAERKLNELQESMDKELLNLQTQVVQYRGENKTQSIALESYRKNEEELKMNMEEKRQQILQFQDQTESLQLLWQDGQQQKELL
ncbi:MAG: hypothetical protein K1X29_11305, partial [Bdellovibrionales bacterium]|nr:hypothetical protein [Bdellovibrionales bacterium]